MTLKELLEKMEDNEEVEATLIMNTNSSHSYRQKAYIAWASDLLANEIWLDKDVVNICLEQLDDYTCRIRVTLSE